MHTFYYVPNEQESTENIPRSLLVDEGAGLQKYYRMSTRSRYDTSGRNKRTRKINKHDTICLGAGWTASLTTSLADCFFFLLLKYRNKYSWFLSLISPQQNLSKELPRDFLLLLMTSLHFSHFRSGALGVAKYDATYMQHEMSVPYIYLHPHPPQRGAKWLYRSSCILIGHLALKCVGY